MEDKKITSDILERVKKTVESDNKRGQWSKGVALYKMELLEEISDAITYGEDVTLDYLKKTALNGADDWAAYSYGGFSLIYNGDIAERLATPSELKKKRGGELEPNSRETWLDVQARALHQAYNSIYIRIKKEVLR